MSEEKLNAFYELINGFEIAGSLTDEGKKFIKDGVQHLQQENKQLKEKVEYLKERKENSEKWCQLIADIGFDYDGYNDSENLKQLIDELVQYAIYCRDGYSYEDFIKEGVKDE